ncbi:kinesin-like protein KIN-13B [Phragmites australis]|uniref:kinesin-like protein KIN-13B n=1 Tax=Phragmites australis TaxID=29695 RepID=UPI002D77330C|nr:kinesin-like protein KIN-13B [Phragmites australis]
MNGGGRRRYSSEHLPFDVPANAVAAGAGLWAQQRGGVRRGDGEIFVSVEPATPARLRGGDAAAAAAAGDSPGQRQQLSPGLLDLHAFDTELIPDFQVPGMYDGAQKFGYGGGFDDSDLSFAANKEMSKSTVFAESNYLKAFPEKVKAAPVAKIKVVVRKRPLNKKEISKKEEDIIDIEQRSNSLTVHETKLKVDLTEYVEKHEFVFDAVLDEDVSNDEVYRETVEPVVPAIFNRTKATCFAYGQTGSGKTYTMRPLPLKASQDILRLMHHTYRNQGFQLFFSFFEIYGGKLFDLLNDRSKLCMREDGKQKVCIVGLQEYRVSDVETIKELIEKGSATRSTGTTGANEESSRSHAILQLAIKRRVDGNDSKPPRPVGKLSFIDLAGSERGADTTDNDKQTRIEGAEINKSLLALKECIRALDNDQMHIPFRGSKLTEVLRDSFIGDSRTVMISCISPSSGSCEHTLNTLRYADRVKSLSKGGNAKKEVPLAAPLRESGPSPLSSVVPSFSASEVMNDITERSNFGWPKQQFVKEQPAPTFADRMPKVKEGVDFSSSNGIYFKEQISKGNMAQNIAEVPNTMYQQGRQLARRAKDSTLENNMRNSIAYPIRRAEPDEENEHLNDLLQEEEDLVSAHRKQVEETLDILREEMNMLGEADQPGNQLDDYITRLSSILSQKAAGIVDLQARLEQFQKRLNENNVLLYA